MKRLIVIYIVLAAIIFAVSVLMKDGIMCFPYETDDCHRCLSGEYYGL